MVELSWHVEAIQDLDAVAAYIAHDAPATASQFVVRVVAATDRLRDYPRLGRVVPELHDESFREVLFQNYRIVYRVLVERVVILAIVHASMDMEGQSEQREWDLT